MAWLWLSMLADAGLVGARLVTDAVLSPGESPTTLSSSTWPKRCWSRW